MKKLTKLIGWTLTEITVHSIETIQGIEIKIIEEEIVQVSMETEVVQDIGKEEAKRDLREIKDDTKPSIITEKTRSITMTKDSTTEVKVEKDQIVETESDILHQMEEDTEKWAKEEDHMTGAEVEINCQKVINKKYWKLYVVQ